MIRVVCVDISQAQDGDYRVLYRLASPERRERADRYLRREDAMRCVTADALLRYVTGGEDLTVARTAEGKPYLPDKPDFHFSLTHSGNFVAIAYGAVPVGVDVEQIRPEGISEALIRRFFAPEEQSLASDPEAAFRIWSMKESYLKCLGTGLVFPLQNIHVLAAELAPQFYVGALPGHTLAVFSGDTEKKVEFLPLSRLISYRHDV